MSNSLYIGGEFKIELNTANHNVPDNIKMEYSLGRTCLFSILKSLNSKGNKNNKILIPDYLCYSVVEVLNRLGMEICHYHILDSFLPDLESLEKGIKECEIVLLITYFGMIDVDDAIRLIRKKSPSAVIIIDDVQNYYGYGNHVDYDYCFTSYRKWFPVPDGADILSKEKNERLELYSREPEYAEQKAAGNLLKNYSGLLNDAVILGLIETAEKNMDNEYLYACSSIATKLIKWVDFENAKGKRIKNALVLHDGLVQMGIQHLFSIDKVPMHIPISFSKRTELRNAFFREGIFCPIHWPVINHELQGNNDLYSNELSLICDQRYDEEDMMRILRVIENEV